MAGLGSSTLSNLIKRNNIPTFSTLDKICTVLGVSMSSFIKDIEDENPVLFNALGSGAQRFDPLSSVKKQIIKEWSALPSGDRNEILNHMININCSLVKESAE